MTAVTTTTPAEVATRAEPTAPLAIIDLFRLAIEKGVPVEALERLQALHERVSDRAAAAEFAAALASFQDSCPPISRASVGNITTKSGGGYQYKYASLPEITRTVQPHLRDAGLSYSWDTVEEKGTLRVTCVLRHLNGHRESASFSVPIENTSGMSAQQKPAAAFRTCQRQTLISVLGLTTADPDFVEEATREPVTADQADDLIALCEEVGVPPSRVLKWAGVSSAAEVPAVDYETICARVRAAKRGQR